MNWVPELPGEVPEPKAFERPRWHVFVGWGFLLTVCCWSALFVPHDDLLDLGDDRRGVQRVAGLILDTNIRHEPRAIYVYGEPALFFQLQAAGEGYVAPIKDFPSTAATLAGRAVPTFLVAGPHADRDPQFREQLEKWSSRWKLVQNYEYKPSKLVWLDLHDPRKGAAELGAKRHSMRLYQLQE